MNEDYSVSEVKFAGYEVYRTDRDLVVTNKTKGGGVLIAVRSCFNSRLVTVTSSSRSFDHIFVSVKLSGQTIIFGCTYIPPSSPLDPYVDHCSVVEDLVLSNPDASFYLSGDYNLTSAVWSLGSGNMFVDCPPSYPAVYLCEAFNCLSLFQVNTLPNSRGAFLDLLFCNNAETDISVPLDRLHHNTINHDAFSFSVPILDPVETLDIQQEYLDYANCDFVSFRSFLKNLDWGPILSHHDETELVSGLDGVDNIVNKFNDMVVQCIKRFTPIKYCQPCCSFPKWFSKNLKKLTREKKKAHLLYKCSRLESDYRKFSELRAKCKYLSIQCYDRHIQNVNSRLKLDPQYFWRYSAESRKVSGFPKHMSLGDMSSSSANETVDLFADSFSLAYLESNNTLPEFRTLDVIDLNSIYVSNREVFNVLTSLPPKFSAGPDSIPPFILKKLASEFCDPLTRIFNLSLSSGVFPSAWKSSFLFPIFKSGNRSDIANYRGVCNQSAIPKILDKLVSKHLSFASKHFVADEQHGFISKRSTVTNLLSYQHDILDSFQVGSTVHSVYTDVAKAFDRVDARLLVSKLRSYGLGEQLLKWLTSYLHGRIQRVKIGSIISKPIPVASGVGQGSHIGPVLFSLFFNDLPGHILNSSFLMFADDVKIYKAINNIEDCILLQQDISRFSDWLTLNGLQLSLHKCVVMEFSRTKKNFDFTYSIQSVPLNYVETVKDLGILFDRELTFASHISNLTMRCFKRLGYVFRNSKGLSLEAFILLYTTLIRSLLEYGCVVWSPYYDIHTDSLERVQKKFFRYVSYRYPLNSVSLASLNDRRVSADINFFDKLIEGNIDCSKILELIGFDCHRRLRGKRTFFVKFFRTNYSYFSPINRMMRVINNRV